MNKKQFFGLGRLAMLCIFLAASFGGAAWSQEFRGTISGVITDPSGAVVPGAHVVVKEIHTGTTNVSKETLHKFYIRVLND